MVFVVDKRPAASGRVLGIQTSWDRNQNGLPRLL